MKRTIILLMMTILGIHVSFAYDFEVDGIYYNVLKGSTNQVEVTESPNYNYSGDIDIPQKVSHNGTNYTIVSIGESAFSYCEGLLSVSLPSSLEEIGYCAFCNTHISKITIPNSVKTIGYNAFSRTDIKNVYIPASVNYIDQSFEYCFNLTSIDVDVNNKKYVSLNYSLYSKDKKTMYCCPAGLSGTYSVIDGTEILWGAFIGCIKITSIILPKTIKTISDSCFSGCEKLQEIEFPNSVVEIGAYIFSNCKSLSTINSYIQEPFTIPELIDSYSGSTFYEKTRLIVPLGCVSKYRQIKYWNNFQIIEERKNNEYSVNITSSGNGSVTYNSTSVKNKTQSFTVNEGSSATLTFTPDNGYRLASVKVGSKDVTSSVSNNKYTISNISANTTVSVTFEAIPVTTYTLSITASGNGSVTYNSTSVKNKTQSFTVNEGTSATLTFTPDNGYRLASVKVGSKDVTSSVSNNKYTISNISANTTVSVTFEAIPVTTYTLSITSSGNGYAKYISKTVRNTTESFSEKEGTYSTVFFYPDDGYRIKCVKVNNADITSVLSGNNYTVTVMSNTTIIVIFEAIPVATHKLSIAVTGRGSVGIKSNTISGNGTLSGSAIIYEAPNGSSATLTFTPEDGYTLKSVKENGTDVSAKLTNNEYTLSNISSDITIEVIFEKMEQAIDIEKYLSAMFTGGSMTQVNKRLNSGSQLNWRFTNNSEADVTLKSLQLIDGQTNEAGNIMNVDKVVEANASVSYTTTIGLSGIGIPVTCRFRYEYNGNEYSIDAIYKELTIPETSYSLSIKCSGNGYASYNNSTIRNTTSKFTVKKGESATVSFTSGSDNYLKNVTVDNKNVTSNVINGKYTISSMSSDVTISAEFEEIPKSVAYEDVNYNVTSYDKKTVSVASGSYGKVLTVPESFTKDGVTWQVDGIEKDALKGNTTLAAVEWYPSVAFTEKPENRNLLLYVSSEQLAPSDIRNVIVGNTAKSITLSDATSGNDFYCPREFTATNIRYVHSYRMKTGIGESRGWETIALPFDVQKISHASKGEIVPFAKWNNSTTTKPFWLYEMGNSGFIEADAIMANTPYIISMPNNDQYQDGYCLNGTVTFEANNVKVKRSDELNKSGNSTRTFVPNFSYMQKSNSVYALNVNNEYENDSSGFSEGSRFILNSRSIHPFEAYFEANDTNAKPSFDIFEDVSTDIRGVRELIDISKNNRIFNINGQQMNENVNSLPSGIYIINGKKTIIR